MGLYIRPAVMGILSFVYILPKQREKQQAITASSQQLLYQCGIHSDTTKEK